VLSVWRGAPGQLGMLRILDFTSLVCVRFSPTEFTAGARVIVQCGSALQMQTSG
jgi:hypothetical protein